MISCNQMAILLPFLDMAVPIEIHRQSELPASIRERLAHESAQVVAERGDVIQFRAKGTASATASLIRGLAALAYQPGGVNFAGRHWCTDHRKCEAS